MTQDQLIQKRIEEKNKRIQEYRSETQLSIQLGQALNLAVQVMNEREENTFATETDYKELDRLVDFFMSFLDKKRKQVFDENERAYRENPAPTPDQYEQMNVVQKNFLKDKQLEANRKAYAERNKRRSIYENREIAKGEAEMDIIPE